jgi:hypothetical protein
MMLFARKLEQKRRIALAAAAAGLGFSFSPQRNPELAARVQHLRGLSQGTDQYAENTFVGLHRGHAVTVFEFHNTTTSSDSDHQTKTDHHQWHIVLLDLGRSFPGLIIAPENILTKVGKLFGQEDIEVESPEFSRKFSIRSDDKTFAQDFCQARLTDFLLGRPAVNLEVSGRFLAFVYHGRISPQQLQEKLDLAVEVRERLPGHLFTS